jgi:hypothetical protein
LLKIFQNIILPIFQKGSEIVILLSVIPPKPHIFTSVEKRADSIPELLEIITKIDVFLPQLSQFISQMTAITVQNGINIVIEANGNLAIDVPGSMSDIDANNFSQRIGILDRIITSRIEDINDLVEDGVRMESVLKRQNPPYTNSKILEQATEFQRIKNTYRWNL